MNHIEIQWPEGASDGELTTVAHDSWWLRRLTFDTRHLVCVQAAGLFDFQYCDSQWHTFEIAILALSAKH